MSSLLLWLCVSYAVVLGIGAALQSEGMIAGWIILIGFPAWRLYRRLRPGGRYRLPMARGIGETTFDASREENAIYFKICLVCEIGIILGLLGLMLLPIR
jgi:hypothetical protein